MSVRFDESLIKNMTVFRLLLTLTTVAAVLFAFVSPTHADGVLVPGDSDTYTSDDQFVPDSEINKPNQAYLTVKKLLSKRDGVVSEGSSKDESVLKNPNVGVQLPGVGVTFTLLRITPRAGVSFDEMDPQSSNFDVHECYIGKTDGDGVIKNASNTSVTSATDGYWHMCNDSDPVNDFPVADSEGQPNYYLMKETDSPYTRSDDPLYDPSYQPSSENIFDLPYRALNKTTQLDTVTGMRSPVEVVGRVYHLHLFPKNVAKNDLMKTATKIVDAEGKDRGALYAQVGDTVSWEVNYRLYNDKAPVLGDGKLDIKEILNYKGRNRYGHDYVVAFIDRVPSSLRMHRGRPDVKLNWQDADGVAQSIPITAQYSGDGSVGCYDSQGKYIPGTGVNVYRNIINEIETDGTASLFVYRQMESNLSDYLPDHTDPQLNGNQWIVGLSVGDITKIFPDEHSVSGVSHMWISWTYETKFTGGGGDFLRHQSGLLINDVAAETIDTIKVKNGTVRASGVVATPGVQFGKTNKPEKVNGQGMAYSAPYAIFRLTRPEDKYGSMSFLYEDGNFYDENSEGTPQGPPSGVKPVQGISTGSGIITFIGIPIVKKDPRDPNSPGKATELKFGLYEYKEPVSVQGIVYIRPERVFKYVDFSEYAGKTPTELARTRGSKGIPADNSKLDFGPYQTPDWSLYDLYGRPNFVDDRGKQIEKMLMNWQPGQSDPGKVGALPIAGGRGVLRMLFAGIVLMIAGMAYRKYMHNKTLSSRPSHANK